MIFEMQGLFGFIILPSIGMSYEPGPGEGRALGFLEIVLRLSLLPSGLQKTVNRLLRRRGKVLPE